MHRGMNTRRIGSAIRAPRPASARGRHGSRRSRGNGSCPGVTTSASGCSPASRPAAGWRLVPTGTGARPTVAPD